MISACDEVLIVELMFSGIFNKMIPEKIAAFLSAVVFDENMKEKKTVQIKE
jgi:superfamily II RNA helicase